MAMSLIYYSIVEAVRRKRSTPEIVEELASQSFDDHSIMLRIILKDLIEVIRQHQEQIGK